MTLVEQLTKDLEKPATMLKIGELSRKEQWAEVAKLLAPILISTLKTQFADDPKVLKAIATQEEVK